MVLICVLNRGAGWGNEKARKKKNRGFSHQNFYNPKKQPVVVTLVWSMMIISVFAMQFGNVAAAPSIGDAADPDEMTFPVVMPRVQPRLPLGESYLCTAFKTLPDVSLYVTEIEPLVAMETAHHLMLVGCSETVHGGQREALTSNVEPQEKNLWNCGGSLGEAGLQYAPTCQGGDMQVGLFVAMPLKTEYRNNYSARLDRTDL